MDGGLELGLGWYFYPPVNYATLTETLPRPPPLNQLSGGVVPATE